MILITGANGLAGRALVRYFLQRSCLLRLHVRNSQSLLEIFPETNNWPQVEIVELDFAQAKDKDFQAMVEGCKTIVHTAGLVHKPSASPGEYTLLNVRATRYLAQIAEKLKVETFIFLSTIGVYGTGPFVDISETNPLAPASPYTLSKAACEEWLKNLLPAYRTVILRPALIFGEGDRGNMLTLIRQISKGLYFNIGLQSARKSLIYAKDVAAAIACVLEKLELPGLHIFNLANPQAPTVAELAKLIADCLGQHANFVTIPKLLANSAASLAELFLGKHAPISPLQIEKLTASTTCSVRKFQEATGFMPETLLIEALQQEINWARTQGLLN